MRRYFLLAFLYILPLMAADTPGVRVGVQIPLSGDRASVGRLMLNGLQMAVDTVNSGSSGVRVELKLADDESTAEGAAAAVQSLAEDEKVVAVMGEINSPLVLASAPVAGRAALPYLTAGSSPATTAASPFIFRVGASDAFLADTLTRYVIETLKITEIAIVHDKTGIHNQRALAIARLLESRYGTKPVLDAAWNPGERSFSKLLEDVKASGARAVIALGETPEGGPFFRAWKAAGIEAQVIGQRDFGVRRVFDDAGSAADGALIFTEYAPDLQSEAVRAWNDAYRKRYGNDANVIAVQYYDALLLAAEAIRAGGATRTGVKDAMGRIRDFHGIMADYSFDSERNGVHRFYLGKIEGGKLIPKGTFNQTALPQQ